jgi:hypothetical protein
VLTSGEGQQGIIYERAVGHYTYGATPPFNSRNPPMAIEVRSPPLSPSALRADRTCALGTDTDPLRHGELHQGHQYAPRSITPSCVCRACRACVVCAWCR